MEKDNLNVFRDSGSESPDAHGYRHGSVDNKFEV